jgi:hypothetical protein
MLGWRWGDSDDDEDDDDDEEESEPPALTESGEMGNESPTEWSDEEQMLTPRFNPTPFFPTILPDVVAVADDVAAAAGCASSCMARLDSLTMKRFFFLLLLLVVTNLGQLVRFLVLGNIFPTKQGNSLRFSGAGWLGGRMVVCSFLSSYFLFPSRKSRLFWLLALGVPNDV